MSRILQMLVRKSLAMIYPNLESAFPIYLCILTFNASAKRSLSVLKHVKNYFRNSIRDNRLSALAFFSAYIDLVNAINYEEIKKYFLN